MNLRYYISSTYRRKKIDATHKKHVYLYKGVVLDIGGRDRGAFKKPKQKVEKWIFADIEAKHNPDIILDVANMTQIADSSIDTVSAIELFEHVEKISEGIKECHRILKPKGLLLISVPFLYPVHADPYDFQRWTNYKWQTELHNKGFEITNFEITGRFFTVYADMHKAFIRSLPFGLKHFAYLSLPFLDLLTRLDNTKKIQQHKKFGNYHGGYFIVAKKADN